MPDDHRENGIRRRIRVQSWGTDSLDRLPHPGGTPEDIAADAEAQAAAQDDGVREELERAKTRAERQQRARPRLRHHVDRLTADERSLMVALFSDVDHAKDSDIAAFFAKSEEWVRVARHRARRKYPCGDSKKRLCGRQPDCAHERGRRIFVEISERVAKEMAEVDHD
jgi:hypothetical protein